MRWDGPGKGAERSRRRRPNEWANRLPRAPRRMGQQCLRAALLRGWQQGPGPSRQPRQAGNQRMVGGTEGVSLACRAVRRLMGGAQESPLKHPSIVWGPVWELLLPLGSALPTWAQGLVPQRLLGARVGRPTRPLQQAMLYCCAGQNGHCGDRNLQWVVGGPILGPGLSRKMTWLCLRLQRRKQHWVERGPNSS